MPDALHLKFQSDSAITSLWEKVTNTKTPSIGAFDTKIIRYYPPHSLSKREKQSIANEWTTLDRLWDINRRWAREARTDFDIIFLAFGYCFRTWLPRVPFCRHRGGCLTLSRSSLKMCAVIFGLSLHLRASVPTDSSFLVSNLHPLQRILDPRFVQPITAVG